MIPLLIRLTSPAQACSLEFVGDPIGSPRAGVLGQGFAVRPEGTDLNLNVRGRGGDVTLLAVARHEAWAAMLGLLTLGRRRVSPC